MVYHLASCTSQRYLIMCKCFRSMSTEEDVQVYQTAHSQQVQKTLTAITESKNQRHLDDSKGQHNKFTWYSY